MIQKYNEFLNESIKFKDLVNKEFDIQIGSSTEKDYDGWSDEKLNSKIRECIKHYLFDWKFYYNWTENGKEYSKVFDTDTLEPLMKNIDKTLNTMFLFKNNKLVFDGNNHKVYAWIDKWFQSSKSISNTLRKEYYDYRQQYAGVKLK